MIRPGFIQDDLDLKLLILYIMSHAVGALQSDVLIDLTLCDQGVDYFSVCTALAQLVERENLVLEDNQYTITDKGRRNSEICESSLPFSVRHHCDENLVPVNVQIRRDQSVQGKVIFNEDGTVTASLLLTDPRGPMLELKILAPNEKAGEEIVKHFKSRPEATYHQTYAMLTAPDEVEEQS